MTEHVRDANPMIHDYIQGAAVGVDVKKKTVTVELNKLQSHTDDMETLEVPYDHLVVSVGCTVHDFNIAGVKEHALKLKTIEDAKKIRTAVTECFELASRPDVEGTDPKAVQERTRRATFLIAGGGPSGVELAGEISDLIKHVTRKNGAYPNLAGSTRVIVVEGGPTLVPPFKEVRFPTCFSRTSAIVTDIVLTMCLLSSFRIVAHAQGSSCFLTGARCGSSPQHVCHRSG